MLLRSLPLHITEVHPLHVTGVIHGKGQSLYSLLPVLFQELPEWCWSQWQTALRTPAADFSSGFTPEAFSKIGFGHKTEEVWNQGFLPLDELPTKANKPHLPEKWHSNLSKTKGKKK